MRDFVRGSVSIRVQPRLLFIIAALGVGEGLPAGPAELEARVRDSFAVAVKPILNKSCFACHNADKPKRDLNLTKLETLLQGGKSGPAVVPGKARESLLYRVLQPGSKPHMPPRKQLEPGDIEAVARWIDGLPEGFDVQAVKPGALHWSLRAVERPEPSAVKDAGWARTPIDAFILEKLAENGLAPSPEAGKIDLIRRAYFDLVGLPPPPEEVDVFLLDDSPNAYEKIVDRLLDSPQYGERWARHWLDLARFAESEGFKSDESRPHAWRYRDYVIKSLNADKPYDRFVEEQIAGDELWPGDPDARLATAFNRHYPDESNARNLMQRRQEILNDITDTVGQVFSGLTFGCARCHDHKYDPILHADYYRLQAFFANVRAVDDLVLAPEAEASRYRQRLAVWQEKTRPIAGEMAALEEKKRKQIADDNFAKFPPEIQEAIRKSPEGRTPFEQLMFHKAKPYLYPERSTLIEALGGEEKKRWQALRSEMDKFRDLDPGELPLGSSIADAGREAPKTHVLAGGAYDAAQTEVEPGFLSILDPRPARIEPVNGESTGRRAALAHWLTDPRNPLTARVIVNRLWHYHFGRGIVATPSDFGSMGDPPSHPRLLDWLASEIVREGWSLKRMHRLIMCSSVYRQDSRHRPGAARADVSNRLWWRFPRERLEAEVIRDSALAVAGLLDPAIGGPSVFPPLPAGMQVYPKWTASRNAADANRRSVYIFVRRNARYPLLEAFDLPDTHESCARRYTTITAPQALMLMNGELTLSWAQAFASRLRREAGPSREAQVGRAYRLAYARTPEREEMASALAFLERQRTIVAEHAQAPALPAALADVDAIEAIVLTDFCHMLLNSNEFVYRS